MPPAAAVSNERECLLTLAVLHRVHAHTPRTVDETPHRATRPIVIARHDERCRRDESSGELSPDDAATLKVPMMIHQVVNEES